MNDLFNKAKEITAPRKKIFEEQKNVVVVNMEKVFDIQPIDRKEKFDNLDELTQHVNTDSKRQERQTINITAKLEEKEEKNISKLAENEI